MMACKTRSNSIDGYDANSQQLDHVYSIKRAASSDAELPSDNGLGRHRFVRVGSNDERDDDSTASYDAEPNPDRLTKAAQRPIQLFSRARSESSSKSNTSTMKRLQTIESGVALADSAGNQSSPKPPLHPTSGNPSQGSWPPLLPNITHSDVSASVVPRPEQICYRMSSDQTTNSYYSVDAGKHGFLTHNKDHSLNDDNDSVANGSLVLKYEPEDLPHRQTTPPCILPYHERKRLMELEHEEKRRKRSAAKLQSKLNKSNGRGGRGGGNANNTSEKTPLNDQRLHTDVSGYGTSAPTASDESNKQNPTTGWFGQLLSIVTGQAQQQQQRRRTISIEDESRIYRDQAKAFLKKTERERVKSQEQRRMDELNNIHIPVAKQQSLSGHHNRPKMSSLSNALDSIASCSDDDDEDDISSSDEESGHYWREHDKTTAHTARVWKYGEPPTTADANGRNKTPTKKKMSKHDHIMKRERLLQEEYEYRLRSLKHENDKLSKRFRVFVLVTVALIFAGALAFAFVICIRMLLSI